MKIQITLECPSCQGTKIVKNGRKNYKNKQNYLCKDCKRQFIGDMFLDYSGCHSKLWSFVKQAFVRGCGIRDIAIIFTISIGKVLSLLAEHKVCPSPKQSYYDELEIDEFWSFVGKKENKVWLIYAYHRESGEIVAWVFGKRNLSTAKDLRRKIKELGVSFGTICMDNWDSFKTAFQDCQCKIGKYWTKGIEGNNCRLRHRIRRAFRKSAISLKRWKTILLPLKWRSFISISASYETIILFTIPPFFYLCNRGSNPYLRITDFKWIYLISQTGAMGQNAGIFTSYVAFNNSSH